ncbi:hypothetical protein ACQKM9_04855 [Viridibacillus sp. NPDC093762]|uniref:hypothetical protein n=1 Tax=Viridibacillus sp. NPDC093762 TaxID=3390720 RepID=UPI003D0637EB
MKFKINREIIGTNCEMMLGLRLSELVTLDRNDVYLYEGKGTIKVRGYKNSCN